MTLPTFLSLPLHEDNNEFWVDFRSIITFEERHIRDVDAEWIELTAITLSTRDVHIIAMPIGEFKSKLRQIQEPYS